MASVLSTLGLLLYIPIVVYVPALAFSQGNCKRYYYTLVIDLTNVIISFWVDFKKAYQIL
jgi:hypothetical protein